MEELLNTWDGWGRRDPLWAVNAQQSKFGGTWNEGEFFQTGLSDARKIVEQALHIDPKIPRGVALDFGCGVGRISQALCSHFDSVIGVDIAPSMLAKARELNRFSVRCEYLQNPYPDLRVFRDSSFSFVHSTWTLMHIPPELIISYIREFIRVVHPDGMIAFQLPGEPSSRWMARNPLVDVFFNRSRLGSRTYGLAWECIQRVLGRPVSGWQMHWLPKSEVFSLVSRSGGRTRAALELRPGRLKDYRYFVSKQC